MDQMKIFLIWILREYLGQLFGPHYPREIVNLIILIDDIKISLGSSHTSIKINNKIYVCGYNEYYQLGLDHNVNQSSLKELKHNDIKEMICSHEYTCGLSYRPTKIYTWGANAYGRLGL